jgi:hypothetical protein
VGVEVADHGRVDPASARARCMASRAPPPSSGGAVAWWASADAPAPATTARASRHGRRRGLAVSSTSTAAPSPITNPSRSTSKGRDAVAGSGFFVSAPIWAKALTDSPVTPASTPPASTTSAAPGAQQVPAEWIADAPAAQAVLTVMFGPRAPERIAIVPAAVLESILGTNIGLTRPGPLSR